MDSPSLVNHKINGRGLIVAMNTLEDQSLRAYRTTVVYRAFNP